MCVCAAPAEGKGGERERARRKKRRRNLTSDSPNEVWHSRRFCTAAKLASFQNYCRPQDIASGRRTFCHQDAQTGAKMRFFVLKIILFDVKTLLNSSGPLNPCKTIWLNTDERNKPNRNSQRFIKDKVGTGLSVAFLTCMRFLQKSLRSIN